MDLRFFFKIGVKEELASAFLATLLESDAAFRQDFLALLALQDRSGRLHALTAASWQICTENPIESGRVDIELQTEDASSVILIENKVFSGSLQQGQLLKYYEALADKDPSKRTQIGAVLLGPGDAVGTFEVERVEHSRLARGRTADFAVRVGWLDLQDLANAVPATEVTAMFAKSGFREIVQIIKEGDKIKWPPVGDRGRVWELAKKVRDNLQHAFPLIQLGHPWPERDSYTLWTQHSNVTMWLLLKFQADAKHPFEVHLEKAGRPELTLIGQLKLSAAGRRLTSVRSRWEEKTRDRVLAVSGLEPLRLSASGWATTEPAITGTEQEVVDRATEMGRALIAEVLTYQS